MSKLTKAQRQHNKMKKLEYLGKARNKVEKYKNDDLYNVKQLIKEHAELFTRLSKF